MVRTLRLLALLLVAAVVVFAIVGFVNNRELGGGFYPGLDALLKRATDVREAVPLGSRRWRRHWRGAASRQNTSA